MNELKVWELEFGYEGQLMWPPGKNPVDKMSYKITLIEKSEYDDLKQKFDETLKELEERRIATPTMIAIQVLSQELDSANAEIEKLKIQLTAQEILNTHASTFKSLGIQEKEEFLNAQLTEQVRANEMHLGTIAKLTEELNSVKSELAEARIKLGYF